MEPEYYELDMAAKKSGIAAAQLQRLVIDGLLPATVFTANHQKLRSYPDNGCDFDERMIDGVITHYCKERKEHVPYRYLAIHRDDLQGIAAPTAAPQWPWGSHDTKLLGHLAAAAERFWKNYDPTDHTTAPLSEDVKGWLQERGLSSGVASAIAQILRANDLPSGPRT